MENSEKLVLYIKAAKRNTEHVWRHAEPVGVRPEASLLSPVALLLGRPFFVHKFSEDLLWTD